MSLLRDIRAALEAKTRTANGVPPATQCAFDDPIYTPAVNIPWIRSTFMPISSRAFSISAGMKEHIGLFQIDSIYPAAQDMVPAEILADAIRDVFAPSTRVVAGTSDIILIDYSERHAAMEDGAWICIPTTVGWRCYSTRN